MLNAPEREWTGGLWAEKLAQDFRGLLKEERHPKIEPRPAEFVCALASGCRAPRLLEIGGSSALSTIAFAAGAGETSGRLVSIEMEPRRQQQSRQRLESLAQFADLVPADAGRVLDRYRNLDFALIDCEKDNDVRCCRLRRRLS